MILEFTNRAEYIQARTNWKEQKANLAALQRQYKIMRNPANQPDEPIRADGTVRTDPYIQRKKIQDAGRAQYDLYVGKQMIARLEAEIVEAKKKASAQYLAQRDVSAVI